MIFLKAPLALVYTNLEGERAPKKCDFLAEIFVCWPVVGLFFEKLACGAKYLVKLGSL